MNASGEILAPGAQLAAGISVGFLVLSVLAVVLHDVIVNAQRGGVS